MTKPKKPRRMPRGILTRATLSDALSTLMEHRRKKRKKAKRK